VVAGLRRVVAWSQILAVFDRDGSGGYHASEAARTHWLAWLGWNIVESARDVTVIRDASVTELFAIYAIRGLI
jgi:hypothetical protein